MAIAKLPNGRFRATVKHPESGNRVSAADVIRESGVTSYRTKTEARAACDLALKMLRERVTARRVVTVADWRERWLNDPMFRENWPRPRGKSTTITHEERTRAFAAAFGHLPLDEITDELVSDWRATGKRDSALKVLKTMFADAMSKDAGRLTAYNPFDGLGRPRGRGRKDLEPPSEAQIWELIGAARKLAPPSFAAWLQVACFTGCRPSEVDALKWDDVDFDGSAPWSHLVPGGGGGGWLRIDEQWGVKAQMFTCPKNTRTRYVPMHDEVAEALMAVRGHHPEFCFVGSWGDHWRSSSRWPHWNAVRAAVGWERDLYLATRHFAGFLMYVTMELPDDVVGIALGHTGIDPGVLVRSTYGHRSEALAMAQVRAAFKNRNRSDRLRVA